MGWLKWGFETSEVFMNQELDAFRERFKRGGILPYIILVYWLARPMTLFLCVSYCISKVSGMFSRKRNRQQNDHSS
jgi:hypothetical protein